MLLNIISDYQKEIYLNDRKGDNVKRNKTQLKKAFEKLLDYLSKNHCVLENDDHLAYPCCKRGFKCKEHWEEMAYKDD